MFRKITVEISNNADEYNQKDVPIQVVYFTSITHYVQNFYLQFTFMLPPRNVFSPFFSSVQLPCHPITKAEKFREIVTKRYAYLSALVLANLHAYSICILTANIFCKKLLTISLFAAEELRGREGRNKEWKWWTGGLRIGNSEDWGLGQYGTMRSLPDRERGITKGVLQGVFSTPK